MSDEQNDKTAADQAPAVAHEEPAAAPAHEEPAAAPDRVAQLEARVEQLEKDMRAAQRAVLQLRSGHF